MKTIDTQFAAGIAPRNMLAGLRLSHPDLPITSRDIYNMRKAKAAAFLAGSRRSYEVFHRSER